MALLSGFDLSPDEIKAARKKLGLSQEQMALYTGYASKFRISEIERGVKPASAACCRLIVAYLAGYRPADWPSTC
ncbi:helix-turn-helix domain-containing protein [Epibacterium ulvae]|uniref:helix-turn-helix domain-containing protein n=1 Tax=Epibacterium ulvae TaxID=1156985 RepID=UPI0038B77203